jgi:hypothetical protein
VRWRN